MQEGLIRISGETCLCAALGLEALARAPDQMPTLAHALSRAVGEERGGRMSVFVFHESRADLDTGGPAS